jgi:hypothetical protein
LESAAEPGALTVFPSRFGRFDSLASSVDVQKNSLCFHSFPFGLTKEHVFYYNRAALGGPTYFNSRDLPATNNCILDDKLHGDFSLHSHPRERLM